MSIYNLNPALESPPYGDKLEAGELFLDGTDSFISSDGNEPVVDVVDYVPSKINVDGSEVDNDISKWPGQRGTYGFFGEYENGATAPRTDINVTASMEGDWLKGVADTAASAYFRYQLDDVLTTNDAFVYCLVRKGTDVNSKVRVSWNAVAENSDAIIDWDLKTITMAGTSTPTDEGSFFISDEIAVVMYSISGTSTPIERAYVIVEDSNYAIGDTTYFKDFMVAPVPYAVPFTAGTHQPSKLQYNKDWAESAEWTIDFWYGGPYTETAFNNYILDTIDSSELDGIRFYININGLPVFLVKSGGVADNVAGDFVPNDSKVHFKLVLVSATSIELFQDGVSKGIATTSIPTVANMPKFMVIGSTDDYLNPALGYIQDFTIQTGIDTSTTHYTSGLPYYDPDKTYGQDGSWSIDKRGNISGLFQQAGDISEDYELDGQRVTKWDTGRMDIDYYEKSSDVNPIRVTFVEPFIDQENMSAGGIVERSGGGAILTCNQLDEAYGDFYRWTDAGVAGTYRFRLKVTGRWK